MFGLHPLFIIGLVLVVLIIFGPGRLPELGGALGKGIREFRKATDGVKDDLAKVIEEPSRESTTSATATSETAKSESETANK